MDYASIKSPRMGAFFSYVQLIGMHKISWLFLVSFL